MMKKFTAYLGIIFLAGCTVPNMARYQVSMTGPGATGNDKEAVREILQTAATSLKLKDLTTSSLVANTIAYFQEIDSNNPVKLMAWTEGDKIFIDLMHWPDQIGETLPYRGAREYIESELKRRFGDRSSTVAFRTLAVERPKPAKP